MTYSDHVRVTLHPPHGGSAGDAPGGSGGPAGSARAGSFGTSRPARPASGRGAARPVHHITHAPVSPREDQHNRIRNYLVSMTIRTVCFALAGIFAVATDWTAAAWVCVIAAALLPYPAVVFANNVDRRRAVPVVEKPYRMLEAGHRESVAAPPPGDERVD